MTVKLKEYKLLYVEDDETAATFMVNCLKRFFKEVVHFNNGKDAYEFLKDHTDIDVMVTDLTMPLINGVELIRLMRNELGSKMPAIALSAHTNEFASELEMLEVPLISKPVDMGQLFAALTLALGLQD